MLYLSGAPLVSTSRDSVLAGPKAHILGVINAFENIGYQTFEYIVGNDFRAVAKNRSSSSSLENFYLLRLAADVIRLVLNEFNGYKSSYKFKNVDLVYERFAVMQSLGKKFKRKGIPWILETNGLLSKEAKNDRRSIALGSVARHLEKRAYENCDLLICVSESLKELIIKEFSIDESKILVIPNGVDTKMFSPRRNVEKKGSDEFPVIGFVGNVVEWQGLSNLLVAVKDLKDDGVDCKVKIVGNGEFREKLISLTKVLNLTNQVDFIERIPWEDVPIMIESFDICFSGQIPLKSGVMYHSPLKIYEYMSMGKIVVASRYPDAISTIGDINDRYLFDPEKETDLTETLKYVMSVRNIWHSDGKKARQLVVERHSWVNRVSQMVPIINGMCNEI